MRTIYIFSILMVGLFCTSGSHAQQPALDAKSCLLATRGSNVAVYGNCKVQERQLNTGHNLTIITWRTGEKVFVEEVDANENGWRKWLFDGKTLMYAHEVDKGVFSATTFDLSTTLEYRITDAY